jgi:formate dehydrogenase major subunit
MKISRRNFLKLSGGSLAIGSLALNAGPSEAHDQELRIGGAKQTTSICPYCSVGCGLVVQVKDGKVINIEGDPDHPINEGTLCSKGASVPQIVNNPMRLTKPRYRAPGATEWKEVEWDWALEQIARKVKDTRDRTFKGKAISKVKEKKTSEALKEAGMSADVVGDVARELSVNRTEGMAHIGSAALDNEE